MYLAPGSRARGKGGFSRGTTVPFIQPTAPLGWTRVTTNDDSLMRINGLTTPGSSGSNGFAATFNTQTQTGSQAINTATTASTVTGTGTSGSVTLGTSQIPSHTHTYTINPSVGGAGVCGNFWINTTSTNTGATGGGGSHAHTVPALTIPSLTVNSFTAGPLSITTGIKYVDALIAKKN